MGFFVFLAWLTGYPAHGYATALAQNFTVEGRFYDGNSPMNEAVDVKFEVLVQDATFPNCVLYTEIHGGVQVGAATPASQGFFALALGNGTPTFAPLTPFTKVFSNSENITGVSSNCVGLTNLTNKPRTVRISVKKSADTSGSYATLVPDTTITSVPTALVAETLTGKSAADFVQLRDDVSFDLSQANVENVFSSANYARLQQLLNPTAALGMSNQRLSNLANPSAPQDAATKNYSDANLAGHTIDLVDVAPGLGGGKVLTWDATLNKWVAIAPALSGAASGELAGNYPNPTIAAAAIVTSKLADNAVTSAKINATGIAARRLLITDASTGATVTYANCANNEILKYTTGTGWQCATVASLSLVTSVAAKTGAVTLNNTDISGLGTASVRNVGTAAGDVPEIVTGGKLSSTIIPSLAGDLSGTIGAASVAKLQGRDLSSATPNAGDTLKWNNTLSRWEPAAITDNVGITALTGDVSASGTGSVAALVANGAITTPKVFVNPGANRLVATDNTSGATLKAFTCNLNETLQWMASGWNCVTTSAMLGTGVISDGGNSRGADLTIGTNDAQNLNFETGNTTAVTIRTSGNVGVGTTNPGRLLHVAGPVRIAPTTLPATPGAGDLAFDASSSNALKYYNGTAWQTVGTGTGDFLANGTVAMTGNLRLNNQWLSGDGGNEGVYVDGSGNVGIGLATPSVKFDVAGKLKATDTYTGTSGYDLHQFNAYFSPASAPASAAFVSGLQNSMSVNSALSLSNVRAQAMATTMYNYSTAGLYQMTGHNIDVGSNSSGTVTAAYGIGSRIFTGVTGGAIGTAIGVDSIVQAAQANITMAKGMRIQIAGGPATVGTAYGLHIDTIEGASKYALYQSDSSAPNFFAGDVGIGTSAVNAKLVVNGSAEFGGNVVQKVVNDTFAASLSAIDWNQGTLIATAKDCTGSAADFSFSNLKSGGNYTFIVGPASGSTNMCIFPATIDGVTVTYKFMPANSARVAAKDTIYNFLRVGTRIYVTWTPGF